MSDQQEIKTEVTLLEDLFRMVEAGTLRVPRFQRPFVWTPEQMRELFDSIERGFPIGPLLMWETSEPVPSLDKMGAIDLPEPPQGRRVSYLLDGNQRLSTLYSVLRLPSSFPHTTAQSTWKWWIYRDLTVPVGHKGGYLHIQPGRSIPAHHMSLRATMRTIDFLGFARGLERSQIRTGQMSLLEEHTEHVGLIERGEQIANQLKSYKVVTIRIHEGSKDQAVEAFVRLNSKGRAISRDEMVSTLTHDGSATTLTESIDSIVDKTVSAGIGEIPRDVIFKTIVAASGTKDVLRNDWEQLARAIRDRLPEAVNDAQLGLERAIEFLREECGVKHIRLLPYSMQLVALAMFFIIEVDPSLERRESLRRFFWRTALSGWFAGANTTQIKWILECIRGFANGDDDLEVFTSVEARSYPTVFDARSARVRTHLLWQLWTTPLDAEGSPMNPASQLAELGAKAYRRISFNPSESWSSNPANRVLLVPKRGGVRQTLLDLPSGLVESILASHHIPTDAYDALVAGDAASFVHLRAAYLAAQEASFIRDLGLELLPPTAGEPDTDSDIGVD
ncbi:MAG: DUF262 domain-containing protein [Deltaproteobacteria bacterium]|nr:DUF262 domain-containing protein [Deltaproteobacteria bacterium]